MRTAPIFFFWAAAALLVTETGRAVGPVSRAGCVAVKTGAIVAIAFVYMRLTARTLSLNHALLVGAAWLVLSMAAEIVTASRLGHAWSELLGPPDSALRNVLMFAWIGAPALFARSSE